IPDPDNMLSPLLHSTGSSNRIFYRNPLVDQLLEQARGKLPYAQRIALCREGERLSWTMPRGFPSVTMFSIPSTSSTCKGVEVGLLGERVIPLKKIWLKKRLAED